MLTEGWSALVVEELEDRVQPSCSIIPQLNLFAPPAIPNSPAAIVSSENQLIPVASPSVTANAQRHELVVIEAGVPDRQALLNSLASFSDSSTVLDVVVLNGGGIQELTDVIDRYSGLDAIHIISHGSAGFLDLGANDLDSASFGLDQLDIRSWGKSLNPGADILIYGCDFAAAGAGRSLANDIHDLTGAEVAANTQLTGASTLGGDWNLNYSTGPIEYPTLSFPNWQHTLSATPLGSQIHVNTYIIGAQQTFPQSPQSVAVNPSTGASVVVWSSQGQNGGIGWNVYFQMYDASGAAIGSETLVDAPVLFANQQYAVVAMNASGDFVVAWAGNQLGHYNIYAQQYSSSGQAQGPTILVDTPANGDQTDPAIAMDAAGDFAIAWQGQLSGSNWGVYGCEFNSSGTATTSSFQVNSATSVPQGGSNQTNTSLAMSPSGNFVITWSGQSGSEQNIYAQQFLAGGTATGPIIQVSAASPDNQAYSSVAMDPSGDFVVVWSEQNGTNGEILEQRYNSSGGILGSPFIVNTTAGDNDYPTVAMDAAGNFVVTWSCQGQESDSSWKVYGQQYLANGLPDGGEFLVNTNITGDQEYSSVDMDANGQYTVVWSSYEPTIYSWGVYAQRFVNSGVLVTPSRSMETATAGGTTSYQVVLQRAPTQNVTIPIVSSDPTQGTPSVSSLEFTPSDWDVPQTVTITGQSDDSTPYFIMNGPAVSQDSVFGGMDVPTVYVNAPDFPQVLTSATSIETTKSGGSATFYVALSTAPVDPVTIALTNTDVSDDLAEGTLSQSTLTFDSTNWNIPQAVTVTGENDDLDNGGVTYQITGTASSEDNNYNIVSMRPITVFNADNVNTAAITVSATSLETTRSGGAANFTVALTSEPLDNASVTINFAMTVAGQGTLSDSTLSFDDGNWNKPQVVTVTGLNDGLDEGNVTYEITGAASSTDSHYDGLAITPISVVNQGTSQAGFTVSNTTLQTTKDGGTANFTVCLNAEPSANVTVTLSTGDSTDGLLSPSTLTFTPTNWETPQTVTVVGVNDFQVTGGQTYQITGTATSSDSYYNDLLLPPIHVVNINMNQAGFSIDPLSVITTKGGDTAAFSVALTSMPASGTSVLLHLFPSVTLDASLSTSTLTFTSTNWDVYQTVTVTGSSIFPLLSAGSFDIDGTATSGDANYNNLSMPAVPVLNLLTNDIVVTGTSLTTTRSGGSASFSVALSVQPTANVTINLNSFDPSEGQLSKSSLSFSSSDWKVPQTVTVEGLNDQKVEGNIVYQIIGTASSNDSIYNGVTMSPVTVTNTGASNTAGITVTSAKPVITTQSGGSGSFSLVLTSAPTSDVVIYLGSSNVGQGSLSSSVVTFTPTNWNTKQTVTIEGLNDGEAGNVGYTITGIASSTDANYNDQTIAAINVVNEASTSAGITVSQSAITTSGEGGTATFTVALKCMPAAPVTIDLTSSDPTYGHLSPTTLVFTPGDWNKPQTVTVIALNTQGSSGEVTYQIQGIATSADAAYNAQPMPAITVTDDETGPAGFVTTPEDNTICTSQDGGQGTFTVALTSAPAAVVNLRLALTGSTTTEGVLSLSELTFSPTNWDVPQSVVVSGVNDNLLDGDVGVRYTITGTASSTDSKYNGLKLQNIQVTNLPTNVVAIETTPEILYTSASGTQAAFNVVLSCEPNATTVVSLTSLEPSAGTLSVSSLTFTTSNWDVPQSVIVTGSDSGTTSGDQTYQIDGTAGPSPPPPSGDASVSTPSPTSGSANFDGVAMTPVSVVNFATAKAGISVAPVAVTTSQSGASGTFSVALTSAPTAPVTVTLNNPKPDEGSLSNSILTFSTTDWNTPQTVTVTGLNDDIADGNQVYRITGKAASADLSYDGMDITPVTVTNVETDVAGAVTSGTLLISEDNEAQLVNSLTGAEIAKVSTGVANDESIAGPDGSFYVADFSIDEILHYSPTGALLSSFATNGAPQGLTFGPDGNLYVTTTNSTVEKYSPAGTDLGTFIAAGSGGLDNAKYIVWGPDGNAYVSSYFNSEVIRYNGSTGAFMNVFATGSGGFEQIAFGPDNNLYVADIGNGDVDWFNGTTGASLGTFADGIPAAYGLAFNSAGDLEVSSGGTDDIDELSSTGLFLGHFMTGIASPAYITSSSDFITSEAGASTQFSIELTSEPLAPVTIDLSSSQPDQGTLSAASLTFSPSNWDVPQTVTVTGLDEHLSSGSQSYQISFITTSNDRDYNSLTISPITIVNDDTDPSTTTSVQLSSNPSTYGTPVTIAATVTSSGSGTPAGSATFFAGTRVLGTVALSAGIAQLTNVLLPAGSYPIRADYSAAAAYGNSDSHSQTMTVSPALLTVTAANASKIYGSSNPTLTDVITGFVNGDSSGVLSGSADLSTNATTSSSIGNYPITAALGSLQAANYTFQFVDGALAITPAKLTVAAHNLRRAFGKPNPTLTYTIGGFVNGDPPTVVFGAPLLATPAAISSSAGVYPIIVGPGSLNAANYTFTFEDGLLTVSPNAARPGSAPLSSNSSSIPTVFLGPISITAYASSTSTADGSAQSSSTGDGDNTLMNLSSGGTGQGGRGKGLLLVRPSFSDDVHTSVNDVAVGMARSPSSMQTILNSTTLVKINQPQGWFELAPETSVSLSTSKPATKSNIPTTELPFTKADEDEPSSGDIFSQLDRTGDEIRADAQDEALTNTLVVTSGVALTGSFLLNTRAVYWFLSALLTRPAVWRRFDPLEVIYAWENDRESLVNPDRDESLQSLVN